MLLNHKVKLITIAQHIIAVAGAIYYGIGLLELATVLVGYFLIFGLGVSGGFHKMISHRSFKTNRFWYFILLGLGTLSGFGSSIAWTVSHRLHHTNSDISIDKDPYYPQGSTWDRIVAWCVTPRAVPYNPMIVKDLLADPVQKFIHLDYFKIFFGLVALIALISPWALVFAWAIPCVLSYHAIQAVGVLSHTYGTQPHDNHDNSRDNYLVGILTFGEGFQNTHHWDPGLYKLHPHDLVGIFIERFVAKK